MTYKELYTSLLATHPVTAKAVRAAVYAAYPGRQKPKNFESILVTSYKAALRSLRRSLVEPAGR